MLAAGVARAATPVTFASNAVPVGSGPEGLAIADFNGDGTPDLAVANVPGTSTISVLLGRGDGTFTQPFAPFPQSSFTLATGDFNGDHRPDLVAVSEGSNQVSILLGNGNGTFSTASGSPITVGSSPNSASVGDFNNDGRPDLAVVNGGSNSVSVLLGDGTGGFTSNSAIPVSATQPASIVAGDFNGDGKLDFAVVGEVSNNVAVYLGNGAGSFTAAPGSPIAVGSSPTSVVVGDFNGDGKPDLAVTNDSAGAGATVSILLGNGNGSFTQARGSPISVGTNPLNAAVGDFNGDGKQDLAVLLPFSNDTVGLLLGNGDGTFMLQTSPAIRVGVFPQSILSVDLNGDGKPDLVVTNSNSNDVSVLLNTSEPAVTGAPSTLPFAATRLGAASQSQPVTITNTGAWTLNVSGVAIVGQDADEFKLSGDGCSDTALRVGESCTVGVRFTPSAAGPASASLRVQGNASAGQVSVPLSAAGFALGSLTFSPSEGPAGTSIGVSSVTPCPTGSSAATISLHDSSGMQVANPTASWFDAGNDWAGTVTVPSTAANGSMYFVAAQCSDPGGSTTQRYAAGAFTVCAIGSCPNSGPPGPPGTPGKPGPPGRAAPKLLRSTTICTTKKGSKPGSSTMSCRTTYTYALPAAAPHALVVATIRVHGHRRVIARGRIRHHRITLTYRHLHKGRYRVTLTELIGHGQRLAVGTTTLVIT